MFRLERFSPALLTGLTELVEHHLRLLPIPWTVTPRELSACLWGSRWPHADFWDHVADLQVACAVDEGRVIGAAQFCRIAGPADSTAAADSGLLNWLYFLPDRADAARALIGHARETFKHLSCERAAAFHQCGGLRFVNFTRGYLSARWEHVDAVLRECGFRPIEQSRQVLMAAELSAGIAVPEPGVAVNLNWRERPDSEVQALDAESGRPAGFCATRDMARASSSSEAAGWSFVAYIEVRPTYRRLGLGEHLLSLQMQHAAQAGKRHMALDVSEQNRAAIELYRKLGFQERDRLWAYEAGAG